jgi:phosphopentomutase
MVTDEAIDYLNSNYVDFTFLYMGYPDAAGHNFGWMGEEYMTSLESCFANMERLINSLPDDYLVIITADHGGHGRTHGTDMPEDMTIPVSVCGKGIEAGETLGTVSIKDIAPTIVKLLGVEPDGDWEGKSFL